MISPVRVRLSLVTPSPRLVAAGAALAVAVGAAGCGGSDTKTSAAPSGGEAGATTTPAPASTGKPGKVTLPASDKDTTKKPTIPKPTGDPPTELQSKDVVVGKGKAAKAGDKVSVQYVGVAWSTGKQFDASWDRGKKPFPFQIGAQQVIPGWDQGVAGMKVGGRRELIIPPALAYGPQGQPPDIGPNETLVFVIDLKKVG